MVGTNTAFASRAFQRERSPPGSAFGSPQHLEDEKRLRKVEKGVLPPDHQEGNHCLTPESSLLNPVPDNYLLMEDCVILLQLHLQSLDVMQSC